MTSEQAMQTAALLLCALVVGACRSPEPISSPYPTTHTWVVAPFRNESGTLAVNGYDLADSFSQRLETVAGLHVLAVNRAIQGMQALDLKYITTDKQARRLLKTIGVDGLVVGTITTYDPYDPPKLGLAVELYIDPKVDRVDALDVRRLIRAATDQTARGPTSQAKHPASIISGFFDAADPEIHEQIKQYAIQRRRVTEDSWRVYRISMDLYTEFVTDLMCRWLMRAEAQRITPTESPSP